MQWEKHIPLTCPTLPRCLMPVLSGLSREGMPQPERKAAWLGVLFYLSPQSPRAAGKRGWQSLTACFREGPADALSLWAVKCPCFHCVLPSLTASFTIISWGTATSPAPYLHLGRSWQMSTAQESSEGLVWEA